jgi:hypothetical protein
MDRASLSATKGSRDEKSDNQADNCPNQRDVNYESDQFQGNKRNGRHDQCNYDFKCSHLALSVLPGLHFASWLSLAQVTAHRDESSRFIARVSSAAEGELSEGRGLYLLGAKLDSARLRVDNMIRLSDK